MVLCLPFKVNLLRRKHLSLITGTSTTTTTISSSSTIPSKRSIAVNLTSILQEAARGGNNENDDKAAVEVVDVDNETSYTLVRPGPNCTAFCWAYFMKFDEHDHPDLTTYSQCVLCAARISRGSDNSTGGMKRHLQFKHFDEYCLVVQKEVAAKEAASA